MVIFIGSSLFILVSFGLTVLGVIGYHGIFVGILVCLALFGYQSLWELYQL